MRRHVKHRRRIELAPGLSSSGISCPRHFDTPSPGPSTSSGPPSPRWGEEVVSACARYSNGAKGTVSEFHLSPRRGEGGLRSKPGEGEFSGFVTGFYEPEVEASPVRTEEFTVPLLSRPADLVDSRRQATGRREWTRIWPSRAERRPDWSNISTARRSNRARWPGKAWKSPGWRKRSMPSSSMSRARRG